MLSWGIDSTVVDLVPSVPAFSRIITRMLRSWLSRRVRTLWWMMDGVFWSARLSNTT